MTNFSVEIVLRLKSDDGRTESDVARLYHGEISSPGAALRVGRDSMEALEHSINREVAMEDADAKKDADPAPPQAMAGMDFANGDGPTVYFLGDLPRGGEPTGLGALLAQLGLVQPSVPDQRRFRRLPEDLNHPLFHDIKRHPANRRDYQYPPQKLQDIPASPLVPFNDSPGTDKAQKLVNLGIAVPQEEATELAETIALHDPSRIMPVPFQAMGDLGMPLPGYLTNDADPRPAEYQPPMAFAEGGPDVAPAGSLAPECTGEIGCPKHAPDGGNHPVAGTPGE